MAPPPKGAKSLRLLRWLDRDGGWLKTIFRDALSVLLLPLLVSALALSYVVTLLAIVGLFVFGNPWVYERFTRKLIFSLDPEVAHRLAIWSISRLNG